MLKFLIFIWFPILTVTGQLEIYHPENSQNSLDVRDRGIYTGQQNPGEHVVPKPPNNYIAGVRLNPCPDRCSQRELLPIIRKQLEMYHAENSQTRQGNPEEPIVPILPNNYLQEAKGIRLNPCIGGCSRGKNKNLIDNDHILNFNQFHSLIDEGLIDQENKDFGINTKKLTNNNNHFRSLNHGGMAHEDNINNNTKKLADNNVQLQSLTEERLVNEDNKDSSIDTRKSINNKNHFQPLNEGDMVEEDNRDLSVEPKKKLQYFGAGHLDVESGDTSDNILNIPSNENNYRFEGHNIAYQSDSDSPQSNKQAKQPRQNKDYSYIGVTRDKKCKDKEEDQLRNDDLEPSRRFTSNVNFVRPNVPFFNEYQDRDTLSLNDNLPPKGLYNHRYDNYRNKFLEGMKLQSNNNFDNINKRTNNVNGNINNENAQIPTMVGHPFTPAEIEGQLIEPAKGVGILDSVRSKIRVMESSRVCYACSSASDTTCSSPNRSTMVKYCRSGHDSCLTKTYQSTDEQQIVIRDCGSTCDVNLSIMNSEYKSCSICSRDLCNDEYVNSSVGINSFNIVVVLFLTVVSRYAF